MYTTHETHQTDQDMEQLCVFCFFLLAFSDRWTERSMFGGVSRFNERVGEVSWTGIVWWR